MSSSFAKIYLEKVTIPTYGVSKPNKNPMFLEKRVYQGSSGRVYPYPVIDKIYDEKKDVTYNAVMLENEYICVMILPELGGRIQRAYDKTNGYDFVYYNEVIKPALVGLLGPWISGGIEFNWPQHHRPTTFMPTSYKIFENEDESVTLAIGDVDEMYGTKVVTRFTLYPGKAYIEIESQLYNRTNHSQTFLWWANPAVAVNDNTQSVFPPDVTAVYDHGKRDVSSFPIAHGVYYKHDYSQGVDISRYKNIPVPTSYMAYKSEYDFVGGYDYGVDAGILHIADHHVSPGKKQWTWGCGDFGQAWDRNLTDNNGPYIELMTGVYTDNQPDFTYLAPYEEKRFKQYFMPYKKVGYVKNANLDVMLNLEADEKEAVISAYTTERRDVRISLEDRNGNTIYTESLTLTVEDGYKKSIKTDKKETELALQVYDSSDKLLLECSPTERKEEALPDPASTVGKTEEVKSVEELILIAQHLEQYRHATLESEPYYEEALRRDPMDIRANLFYGELLLKRCRIKEAEEHFRASVKRSTWLTPNPYDSECYYALGLSLLYQERYKEAYDAFYKATWSERECERSFYNLALISSSFSSYDKALYFIERALTYNTRNVKARALKCYILSHLGRTEEAKELAKENIAADPFDFASLYFLKDESFKDLMIGRTANYIYLAWDLISWGEADDAIRLLEDASINSPMPYYYAAYAAKINGDERKRAEYVKKASNADESYAFPNTVEDYIVLESALEISKDDETACYLLGNLSYDKKNYSDAYAYWKKGEGKNATALRNLSIVLYNKMDKGKEALEMLEKAFSMDKTDSRILLELVQLEEKLHIPYKERLALLKENYETTKDRDDLFTIYLSMLNREGRNEEVLDLLSSRIFHPWEGGEGKVTKEYVTAHKDIALSLMAKKDYDGAIKHLDLAMVYPHNLGEGKLEGCKDNEIHYLKGLCYESLKEEEKAKEEFALALDGKAELSSAMYYYDQPADIIFFQALALEKLGREEEAKEKFNSLIGHGNAHLNDIVTFDYFAVSLPDLQLWTDDLSLKNKAHCYYLTALGYKGLKDDNKAKEAFENALKINPDLVDAERLKKIL